MGRAAGSIMSGQFVPIATSTDVGVGKPDNVTITMDDTGAYTAVSVEGATGPTGPQGGSGPAGPSGATGSAGPSGSTGPVGPSGPAGPSGPTGGVGASGASGPSGASGASGASGPAGATGATGATGPAGASGSAGPPAGGIIVTTTTAVKCLDLWVGSPTFPGTPGSNSSPPSGWQATSFDDSAWPNAFETSGSIPPQMLPPDAVPIWTQASGSRSTTQQALFRVHVTLPSSLLSATLLYTVDDAIWPDTIALWVNGTSVTIPAVPANQDAYNTLILDPTLFVVGANVLAFLCANTGGDGSWVAASLIAPGQTGPTGPSGPSGPRGATGAAGPGSGVGAAETGCVDITIAAGDSTNTAPVIFDPAFGHTPTVVVSSSDGTLIASFEGVSADGFTARLTANVPEAPSAPQTATLCWYADAGTGSTGPSGPSGPSGPQGATGPSGPPGATGAAGAPGAAGLTGATGSAGVAGATGSAGATGPVGATGPGSGATGAAGAAGATGATGPAGTGGAQLLAVVNGTDGATAVVNASYAALSTPWITSTLTLAAIMDVVVQVQITSTNSAGSYLYVGIWRNGTQVASFPTLYNGGSPSSAPDIPPDVR